MKKKKIQIFIILGLLLVATFASVLRPSKSIINASNATSYTYAEDTRGRGLIRTQDAYLPNRNINGLGVTELSDVKIGINPLDDKKSQYLYITARFWHEVPDKELIPGKDENGNDIMVERDITVIKEVYGIIVFEIETKSILYKIYNKEFNRPTGLFIEPRTQTLYVADGDAQHIFVYEMNSQTGKYEYNRKYGKPNSVLFEGKAFKPDKISVDQYGNMFIVSGSLTEGIMQLDNNGNFLGYFASNKISPTLIERINKLLGIEANESETVKSQPLFANIYTDEKNLVYSLTSTSITGYPLIKKHNTSGQNLFGNIIVAFDDTPTCIHVDSMGVVYVGMKSGRIYTYTKDGDLLYIFGGSSEQISISGLFSNSGLVGLTVDNNGNLWCIDKTGTIVSFSPTDYAQSIFSALKKGDEGRYKESIELWKEVLKISQSSALAHRKIGMNYLYSGDYELAMYHLRIARDRYNYSQAFWEVRNAWLQRNLTLIVILGACLFVVYFIVKKVDKKTSVFAGVKQVKVKITNNKIISDLLFESKIIKNTMDNYYYLKAKKKGSNLASTIILLATFGTFLWFTLGKGFLYQFVEAIDIDLFALIFGFFGIFSLLVIANWLVTSIQYGEGNFGAIYRMTCACLVPWLISMVTITIASHFLTYNEIFILQFIQYLGIGLTIFLYVKGVQETHYYSLKETIISILLTVLLIAVIILVALLIIMLTGDLFNFIETIFKEVFR